MTLREYVNKKKALVSLQLALRVHYLVHCGAATPQRMRCEQPPSPWL